MVDRGTIVFALLVVISARCCSAQQGCRINITRGLPDIQPLLLKSNGEIYLPNSAGFVDMAQGSDIRLACPGPHNSFDSLYQKPSDISVRCYEGKDFIYQYNNYSFTQFKCKEDVIPFSIIRTRTSCSDFANESSGRLIKVGFEVDGSFGNKLMEICFDEVALTVLWTSYKIVSVIDGYQQAYTRSTFKPFGFFRNLNVDNIYKQNSQIQMFNYLLGPRRTRELFKDQTQYYLAKGHLAAKTDFVYGIQQDGTFAYINVAPQWQIINQGNWLVIEKKVRDLAIARRIDLDVETGVYGLLQFKDDEGKATPLFLHHEPAKNVRDPDTLLLPVPALFWKTVRGRGIAPVTIVSVNNPYFTGPLRDLDVDGNNFTLPGCVEHDCNRHAWLKGIDNANLRGFIYCC